MVAWMDSTALSNLSLCRWATAGHRGLLDDHPVDRLVVHLVPDRLADLQLHRLRGLVPAPGARQAAVADARRARREPGPGTRRGSAGAGRADATAALRGRRPAPE